MSRRILDPRRPACLANAKELIVPVEGLLIRTLVVGDGPPLVLVHGLGTSARSWDRNLDDLSAFATLYVLDLPGFGESDPPDEVLSPERLADVLMRWCLAIDLQRASFLGHSLGGEVCLWLAARYPTMVDRLVLAASTGVPPRSSLVRRLGRLLVDGLKEPFHFMPILVAAYWRAGPRRMLGTIQASSPPELMTILPEIAAPTLVAWGRQDPVVSLEEARALASGIPHARLAVIEEGAHGLIFDAPRRFNQLVCAFLAEGGLR